MPGIRTGPSRFIVNDTSSRSPQDMQNQLQGVFRGERGSDGTFLHGTVEYGSNTAGETRFAGDFLSGIRSCGELRYTDGSKFCGNFNGMGIPINGTLTYGPGYPFTDFTGEFAPDTGLGKCGIMTLGNGDTFTGNFNGNNFLSGTINFSALAASFAGDCQTSSESLLSFPQNGTMHFGNGSSFSGEWDSLGRICNGMFTFNEESEMKEFAGEFEGIDEAGNPLLLSGTLTMKNDVEYTGDFGGLHMRCGDIKWPNGDVYSGDTEEGAMVCGALSFRPQQDLVKFLGDFRDGIPSSGEIHFADGRIFAGEIRSIGGILQGSMSGECFGVMTYPDGHEQSGTFLEGQLVEGSGGQ